MAPTHAGPRTSWRSNYWTRHRLTRAHPGKAPTSRTTPLPVGETDGGRPQPGLCATVRGHGQALRPHHATGLRNGPGPFPGSRTPSPNPAPPPPGTPYCACKDGGLKGAVRHRDPVRGWRGDLRPPASNPFGGSRCPERPPSRPDRASPESQPQYTLLVSVKRGSGPDSRHAEGPAASVTQSAFG